MGSWMHMNILGSGSQSPRCSVETHLLEIDPPQPHRLGTQNAEFSAWTFNDTRVPAEGQHPEQKHVADFLATLSQFGLRLYLVCPSKNHKKKSDTDSDTNINTNNNTSISSRAATARTAAVAPT